MSYRMCQKVKINRHILLVCFIKKIMLSFFLNLFLDINLSLMYKLNTVKILNNLIDDILKNLMSYRMCQKIKKIDIYY